MNFDLDIKKLNDKNANRKKLTESMNAELALLANEKHAVEALNMSGIARAKINEVANHAERVASAVKSTEASFPTLGKRVAEALASAKPVYDKADFINAIKTASAKITAFAQALNSKGLKACSAKDIADFATSYVTVVDISKNAEKIIADVVREDANKKEKLDDIAKRKAAAESKWNDTLKKDEAELGKMLADLDAKLDLFHKSYALDVLPRKSVMRTAFSPEYVLHLGVAEDTARSTPKVATLTNYGKSSISVTDNRYCYDVKYDGNAPANISITYDGGNTDGLWKIVESIILQFVISYPAKFKNVAAIHNIRTNSEFLGIMGRLRRMCNANELIYDKANAKAVSNSGDEIRKSIQDIASMLDERISKLYGYNDVIEYNLNNPDNIQPLTLLFVKDLDPERNADQIEYFKDIARGGNKAGIFVVWMNSESVTENAFRGEQSKLFGHRFKYQNGCLVSGTVKVNCTNGLTYANDTWYGIIKDALKNYSTAIDMLDFQSSITGLATNEYARKLYIPVGKQDADPCILELDSKDEYCHAVVAGTTGTGKTSLLHSIILGGSYHYSPNELEIWLFDFKQGGVEFNIYKSLKHLKVLALNSNKQDVYEILDYLIDTMEERGNLIRSTGKQDINGYNSLPGIEKKLPRILVIIDEYTELANSHKCINQLELVAKQGRAYGISLIMSSQTVDGAFAGVIKQMKHRFDFCTEGRSSLIEENISRFGDLTGAKGTCIYQKKQGVFKVRAAYTDAIKDAIKVVNDRYPETAAAAPILLESPEVKSKVAKLTTVGSYCKKDKTSLKVRLGERNLSSRPVDYRFDADSRFLLLIGDEDRVKNVEYAITDSFAALKTLDPAVYYINAGAWHDDIITAFRDSYSGKGVFFNPRPADIADTLHKIYDIYQERMNALDDGEPIEHPIEVIIHCFNKLPALLERLAARASQKDDTPAFDEQPRRRSSIRDRANLSDDEFESFYAGRRSGGAAAAPVAAKPKSYPDFKEIINTLRCADRECGIYLTLHIEDGTELEKLSSYIFGNARRDVKDAIIVPSIPEDDDILSYKQIIDGLRAVGQHDFADLYRGRSESAVISPDEKNNFNYYILVDENVPFKFLPYEYNY